jgi:hypothetical protein
LSPSGFVLPIAPITVNAKILETREQQPKTRPNVGALRPKATAPLASIGMGRNQEAPSDIRSLDE